MQRYFNGSRNDADTFESLLDCIYASGEDHRQWQTVIAGLTDYLGGVGGALHAGRLDGTEFSFGTSYRLDPGGLAVYADYYYSVNPLTAALSRVPQGWVAPDHHLVARRDMERSEIHDYTRRYDIAGSMSIVLARDSHYDACFGIVRNLRSDVFSDEQVSFVRRLAPHIQRAVGLNRRLAAAQSERTSLETALGCMETAVFVLDRAGVIHYCNAAGENSYRKGRRAECMPGPPLRRKLQRSKFSCSACASGARGKGSARRIGVSYATTLDAPFARQGHADRP